MALATAGGPVLQSVGGFYVDRTIPGASATYGIFAPVIGLLSWFWLASRTCCSSRAESTSSCAAPVAALADRRAEPGDREALLRFAEAARMDRRQEIEVGFGDGEDARPALAAVASISTLAAVFDQGARPARTAIGG